MNVDDQFFPQLAQFLLEKEHVDGEDLPLINQVLEEQFAGVLDRMREAAQEVLSQRSQRNELREWMIANPDEALEELYHARYSQGKIDFSGIPRILYQPIDDLDLTMRSKNCLRGECIDYVYQLVQQSAGDMFRTPNIGQKSIAEIESCLKGHNLSFSMKLPAGWIQAIEATLSRDK